MIELTDDMEVVEKGEEIKVKPPALSTNSITRYAEPFATITGDVLVVKKNTDSAYEYIVTAAGHTLVLDPQLFDDLVIVLEREYEDEYSFRD